MLVSLLTLTSMLVLYQQYQRDEKNISHLQPSSDKLNIIPAQPKETDLMEGVLIKSDIKENEIKGSDIKQRDIKQSDIKQRDIKENLIAPTFLDAGEKQYKQFWANNPNFDFPYDKLRREAKGSLSTQEGTIRYLGHDPGDFGKGYNYNVSVDTGSTDIILHVLEFYHGHVTQGGSFFRGTSFSNNILSVCQFMDHLDGSYSLRCPVFSKCSFVELSLQLVNFTQFKGITRRLDKILVSKNICVQSSVFEKPTSAYWYKTDGRKQSWKLRYNGNDYPLANDEICEMINSLGNLYLLGDSHMRRLPSYYVEQCQKKVRYINTKIKYSYTRYLEFMINKTKLLASPESYKDCSDRLSEKELAKLNRKDVDTHTDKMPILCRNSSVMPTTIMMQSGSWDVAYTGLKVILGKSLVELEEALKQLTEQPVKYYSKLLVIGSPPHYPRVRNYAACQNDVTKGIYSRHLGALCKKYGVAYLDMFGLVYPRYNETQEDNHYLDCEGTCKGEVGKVMAQAALTELTKN